ncbi:MAG TPA: hypothetical protein VFZ48_05575 [Candidatus Saccharimonadales bacterium]
MPLIFNLFAVRGKAMREYKTIEEFLNDLDEGRRLQVDAALFLNRAKAE